MLEFDVEIDVPDIKAESRRSIRADIDEIAADLEKDLRKSKIWPVDTGRSRKRFQVTAEGDDIRVTNPAPYAGAVNNRSRYPRGRRNPNYRAAQRAVESLWKRATR